VRDKLFVWERPLRPADIRALGDSAPQGPILGARVERLGAKEALLTDEPGLYFTTPHHDGCPAVLTRLDRIALQDLHELIVETGSLALPSDWRGNTSTRTCTGSRLSGY
jgi:hypothetical protein